MTIKAVGNTLATSPIPDARYAGQVLPSAIGGSHPIWYPNQSFASDSGRCSRYMHKALQQMTDLVLAFWNPEETGNPVQVSCSIEYPSGTFYEVHFDGENTSRQKTLPNGVSARTVPLGIVIPKGATFYSNTLIIPAASGQYPVPGSFGTISNNAGGATDGGRCSVGTTDYTMTTNPGSGSLQYGYGPMAICCNPATAAQRAHTVQVGIVGDSISIGVGDSTAIAGYANFESGWPARVCNDNSIPYMDVGINGSSGQTWAAGANSMLRMQKQLMECCSTVIWELITNDLAGGAQTFAQVQAYAVPAWQQLAQRGPLAVFATTCVPRTSSTDNWATIANQSAAYSSFGPEASQTSATSYRQQYNAWLRDGCPMVASTLAPVATGTTGATIARCPVYGATGQLVKAGSGPAGHPLAGGGVIDVASVVEVWNSANDTWVWEPGLVYLGDGIGTHPSPAGHVAIEACVPIAAFL